MIRKRTNAVFIFNTVLMFIIPEIKRTASFANIRGQTKPALKLVNNASFITSILMRQFGTDVTVVVFINGLFTLEGVAQFFIGKVH